MSQITIRGLEPEIEQKIRQIARERRQSINHVLSEIIHQSLGKGKRKPAADSLKNLAGGWSEQETSHFLDSIKDFEKIDEEMWQ